MTTTWPAGAIHPEYGERRFPGRPWPWQYMPITFVINHRAWRVLANPNAPLCSPRNRALEAAGLFVASGTWLCMWAPNGWLLDDVLPLRDFGWTEPPTLLVTAERTPRSRLTPDEMRALAALEDGT